MRASLTGLLILALTACSQAPVQPAAAASSQAASSPAAAQPAAPAAAQSAPVAACPPPPPPQLYMLPPAVLHRVPADEKHRLVKIETNLGDMVVQLDAERAPLTVKNFITYVSEHFYDNSGFYRVIPGFVIQGGDYTPDLKYHKPKHPPIPNESGNGLSNQPGAIGMGTDANPHSAQAAFYINLADNRKLDPRADRWGYTVFGQVVEGMDVVNKIAAVKTHSVTLDDKYHEKFDDVPTEPMRILKVTLLPLDAANP